LNAPPDDAITGHIYSEDIEAASRQIRFVGRGAATNSPPLKRSPEK